MKKLLLCLDLESKVIIFFITAGYFPFVYAIAMTLFGDSLVNYLIGIALGHGYIFMKDIVPIRYHKDYLRTPQFFTNWWFSRQGPAAGAPGEPRRPAGFFQGQGVRLE